MKKAAGTGCFLFFIQTVNKTVNKKIKMPVIYYITGI